MPNIPPNLPEANAYLKLTLYWADWNTHADQEKEQAIFTAYELLTGMFPGVDIPNKYVYIQAAYMLTGAYKVKQSNTSSQSVSTTGVSISYGTSTEVSGKDLLAPGLADLLATNTGAGKVKVGRAF